MSKIVLGCKAQNPYGAVFTDKGAKALSYFVPVDQKDDPRSEVVEIARTVIAVFRCVDAGRQQIGSAFRAIACARVDLVPDDIEIRKQALKEREPLGMDVRVGEGRFVAFDADHQNMGIRRANIVLNEKSGHDVLLLSCRDLDDRI